MKKAIISFVAFVLVISLFTSCSSNNIQFVAEFYTETYEVDYDPESPKLEESFVYGDQQVTFNAQYEKSRIVYTVKDPSDDKIPERRAFDEVYSVYYESWNNYVTKLDVGMLETGDENDVKTISLTISGLEYIVTFDPLAESPTIVYEEKTIA